MDKQIKDELERVVARQEKDLKSRLPTFSKGSLQRIVKVLGGPLGKDVKLDQKEHKFIDDLHNYFENHLASLGLEEEFKQAKKEETDG